MKDNLRTIAGVLLGYGVLVAGALYGLHTETTDPAPVETITQGVSDG